MKCSCDKDYEIPGHSFFKKPCIWPVTNVKMPIFSSGILPECFADILVPSQYNAEQHNNIKIKDVVPWK